MSNLPTIEEVNKFATEYTHVVFKWAREYFKVNSEISKIDYRKSKNTLARAKYDHIKGYSIVYSLHNFSEFPVQAHKEYKSFCFDPLIGSFETTYWKEVVLAIICHEVSHLIQFSIVKGHSQWPLIHSKYAAGLGEFETGHGNLFKSIYSIIRPEFMGKKKVLYNISLKSFDYSSMPVVVVSKDNYADVFGLNKKYNGKTFLYGTKIYEVIAYNGRRKKAPFYAIEKGLDINTGVVGAFSEKTFLLNELIN